MAKKIKALKEGYVVPGREKTAFALSGLGQGMIYAMMSSYISDYYTNVLKLPLLFVLLLMLGARVWDAINDPLMGIVADKRTTKLGKLKGYIVYATPLIAVLTIMMYTNPHLSKTGTMVYAAVTYILWGMAYTMADVPYWSIPNVMTGNSEERGQVVSFAKTLNGIGTAVPEVLLILAPTLIPLIFPGKNYYEMTYLSMAVVCVVFGASLYVSGYPKITERYIPKPKKREPGEPSTLARIFKCKPLMLVVTMGVLSSGRYMIQAAAIHVARYAFYIGPELTPGMDPALKEQYINESVRSVKTVFQVCAIVGMFGAMLLMPILMKKFDYKKLLITTCLAGFVASIFTTIIGWKTANFYICTPFILISCIPLGVINVISNAMIYDCLDYIELKTGFRDNGLGSACQGFINKIGNAFATCGIILMYMFIDINPENMLANQAVVAATELTRVQNFGMFTLVSIVPGLSMLLCSIPMFFYKISGDNKKKIMAELKAKREAEGVVVE